MNCFKLEGLWKYSFAPSFISRSLSEGVSDELMTSTFAARHFRLKRIRLRTSSPLTFGRFKSSKTRSGNRHAGSALNVFDIVDRLPPVTHDGQTAVERRLGKRLLYQFYISRIVLDQ